MLMKKLTLVLIIPILLESIVVSLNPIAMKRIIYTISLLIFFSACRSVDKALEKGEYEHAIQLAKKRIIGKNNKSTKNVKFLEKAHAKILKRDTERIKILTDDNKPENLDEIFSIYADINDRQEAIRPFVPLISKDGYKAQFTFLRTEDLMKRTSKKASNYHYELANEYLAKAEAGDKFSARDALNELDIVNRYYKHYEDVETLRKKAIFLGKTRILVKTKNRTRVSIPKGFEDDLLTMNVKSMNSLWSEYFTSVPEGIDIDVVSEIELRTFVVSPEREFVREYVDSKEVREGWDYFLDSNGNVAKDTLGNDIKKPKYKTIFADVIEVKRDKYAKVSGIIRLYDAKTKEQLKTESFNVESGFEDISASFIGDRKALSNSSLKCIKTNPLPFPSDQSLSMDAAGKLKSIMKSKMKKFII